MKNIFYDCSAIILAGGASKRSETIKGLRKFSNNFWLEEQINILINFNLTYIFIGLGHNFEEYIEKIHILKKPNKIKNSHIITFINNAPQFGMFSTLQYCLNKSINYKWENLFLISIDNVIPDKETLDKLFKNKEKLVVKPHYKGKSGHPILLNKKFCKKLVRIDNSSPKYRLDYQIKDLDLTEVVSIEVMDSSILLNMNTKEDWELYTKNIFK